MAPPTRREPPAGDHVANAPYPGLGDLDPESARTSRSILVDRLVARGAVGDVRVIDAMRRVPRHLFVPPPLVDRAYGDHPVPIGHDQTVSQPTVVAMMTEALGLTGAERVLEVGTGSGYQTAILSLLAREVFSVERIGALTTQAREKLARLGCDNVRYRIGDGHRGWLEEAPFDRILITASPAQLPEGLVAQLAEGGVLVGPVGTEDQRLVRGTRSGGQMRYEDLGSVSFVPLVEDPRAVVWN